MDFKPTSHTGLVSGSDPHLQFQISLLRLMDHKTSINTSPTIDDRIINGQTLRVDSRQATPIPAVPVRSVQVLELERLQQFWRPQPRVKARTR
jgi:hypothetical protein